MMVQELLAAKNSVVVTVGPTATLAEAARTMVDHRIGRSSSLTPPNGSSASLLNAI